MVKSLVMTYVNCYLAVEWDLGAVECHQKMVDNNWDVVGGQQQHQDNLKIVKHQSTTGTSLPLGGL